MDALWQFFNDDVRESAALLDARMMLFFSKRASPCLVEAFVLKLGGGTIRCDAPISPTTYTSPGRVRPNSVFVRGSLAAQACERAIWLSRACGKGLGCLCDLFQPHGTRTPRSWTAGAALGTQGAAHQSLCQDLQYWASSRPVAALVETKTWSSRLLSSQS